MRSPRIVPVVLVLFLGSGCLHRNGKEGLGSARVPPECRGPAECRDEQVIRVKAPPHKFVVELPEEEQAAPSGERPESARRPAGDQGSPESARRQQPREPAEQGAPESAELGRPESVLGTALAVGQGLAAVNQLTGFSRTTATTSSLGTVTPGSSGLGFGIRWIHIPVPVPRLFSIKETPSVTVPLTEANLVHAGGVVQSGMVQSGAVQQGALRGGQCGVTREELAAIVEQEIAARNRAAAARRQAAPLAAESDEKRKLEKKLAAAEAQIERLAKTLDGLDSKLAAPPPVWLPKSPQP